MPGSFVPFDRRAALLGGLASLVIPAMPARAQTPAMAPQRRVHGLIIGVNAYTGRFGRRGANGRFANLRPIPSLRGSVNDARLIEAALRPISTNLTVLLDAQASRAAILQAWGRLVQGVGRDDLVILTFSGHGAQQPERVRGSEPDGLDEFLALSGFDVMTGVGVQQQIVDNEIAALLAQAAERGALVVFVADCCHAGTLTRSVDRRVEDQIRYRSFGQVDTEGQLADPIATRSVPADPRVLYLGASQDNELTPEFMINGRYHGALSVAFAEAVSGRGVEDGTSNITAGSLARHVLRAVRLHADAGQHPDVRFPTPSVVTEGAIDQRTLLLGAASPPPDAPSANDIRIAIRGAVSAEDGRVIAALLGVRVARQGEDADLTWDAPSGDCFTSTGAATAYGVRAVELAPVIERLHALARLRQLATTSGLDMRLLLQGEALNLDRPPTVASDRTHVAGTRLRLVISGLRFPKLALFNLTGNGTVQLLLPGRGRRVGVSTERPFEMDVRVDPPFGADHAVAIAGAADVDDLVAALIINHERKEPRAALEAVERYVRSGNVQVGLQGLYTRSS